MAPNNTLTRRVVRTESGPGTAETVLVDEYGSRWTPSDGTMADQTCPPLTGVRVGNMICTGKYYR